jgi:hypothetical protein
MDTDKKLPISALCSRKAAEIRSLAAATATARAILTAIAIVGYDIQLKHGSHLLSNRHPSIDLGKKREHNRCVLSRLMD